jgi:DNA-binding NarL/FixJ family response regulator
MSRRHNIAPGKRTAGHCLTGEILLIFTRAAGKQIRESVRAVAAGESLLPTAIASKLAESMAIRSSLNRERQVLEYIANGRSNKEIGQILYISENTVKSHVKSILTRLDAMGRTEAIAVGIKRGLIKPVS